MKVGKNWCDLGLVVAVLTIGGCGGGDTVNPLAVSTGQPSSDATMVSPVETAVTAEVAQPDADPATLYVSPVVGDDANDGQTQETPWASLQASLDRLTPGQTLYLMDGRYEEQTEPDNAHHIVRSSGTADAWIGITAAPGHSPVVVASNGNGIELQAAYVEVSGLQIVGEGFGVDNDWGWGFTIRNSHHIRLSGNSVSAMANGGIGSVESSNMEIYDNVVFENSFWGPGQGSGISMWHMADSGFGPGPDGYHNRIIGNTIYRNENKVFSIWRDEDVITDGNGIIIDQANETGYTGRTLVANNVVFDNGGRGILILESARVDVMFNTTYLNARTEGLDGGPVELAVSRSQDVRFANNLAWSREGAPAITASESTDVSMGGNVLVTDSPSGLATDLDLVIVDDPGLSRATIDEITADFRPAAGSTVVDRAIAVDPVLLFDADRQPRAAGSADVGAYELAS
jgi:hypothetical protein